MNDYCPDRWLMVRVTENKTGNVHYRVFGSWSGGYLDGDSWRLNSGVERIEVHGNKYHFIGSSGSTYICHKDMYGSSAYNYGALKSIIEKSKNYGTIEELPADTDFVSMEYK